MKFHAILLAGGSGVRVGGNVPKQFLPLEGRPVISYSLEALAAWPGTASLTLAVHPDWTDRAAALTSDALRQAKSLARCDIVTGGATRHQSTLAALRAARAFAAPEDALFIHDSARPHLEAAELERLADYLINDSNCLIVSLASPLTDTIVRADGVPGLMRERLDRSELFAIKTPQAVRVSALELLMSVQEDDSFTDLLSWGARAGIPGHLIAAGPRNRKISIREDFQQCISQ